MVIKIIKGVNKNRLVCERDDGSYTESQLGPSFPHHDMAHYAVESTLKLRHGFLGLIQAGKSIQELSNNEVIANLNEETMLAEVCTRNLQAIFSGASTKDQFIELVHWELVSMNIRLPDISNEQVTDMVNSFQRILRTWQNLLEGESLMLNF